MTPNADYGAVPPGAYDLWADADDVIGLTVAKTYPSGLPIMRIEPPFMDAFDEIGVGHFLAACLTNAEAVAAVARHPAP